MSLWTNLQRPAMELMFSGEKTRRPTEVIVVQLLFPTRMAPWHPLAVEKNGKDVQPQKIAIRSDYLGNAWKTCSDNAILPVRCSIPSDQTKAMAAGSYEFSNIFTTHCNSTHLQTALESWIHRGYEGGEVQFFEKWGSRRPVASYKCAAGCGIAFCGCHRNIHAVTGVKRGFRLVLLVWTRPPGVPVPEGQDQVCYFRPGTGNGCWLHTAEIRRGLARRGQRESFWEPKDADSEDSCNCAECRNERGRISWKESW